MNELNRIYPGSKIIGINELLVEGCSKFYPTLIQGKEDTLEIARKGIDALGRKIRIMNIRIEFMGRIANPDFAPHELID